MNNLTEKQKVKSQTDYYYDPTSGQVFYDKTLKEKMYCPVHPRTQLYGGYDPLHCPTCKRLGLGLHWKVGVQIEEKRAKVEAETDRLIKKISEFATEGSSQ